MFKSRVESPLYLINDMHQIGSINHCRRVHCLSADVSSGLSSGPDPPRDSF